MRTLFTLTVCLLAAMLPAWAASADLKPSQIFAADSPSIVVVMAYGEGGKAIAQGGGVVIAKDTVVSNCHVIEKATTARITYRNKTLLATLHYADGERDLCSFVVKGLGAPPVQLGSTSQVKVGDAAYAGAQLLKLRRQRVLYQVCARRQASRLFPARRSRAISAIG